MQIQAVQKSGTIDMIIFAIKIILILIFIYSNGVFAYDRNRNMEEKRILKENEMDYDEIDTIEIGKSRTYHFIDGWCEKIGEHMHKTKYIYKYDDGMIKINEYISNHKNTHALNYSDDYEHIITIYDKKGNLLFSKHYIWVDNMLVRTVDDSVTRNIISGKTPCDFKIVESSSDSIVFHLDPKKRISGSIKNHDAFSAFINGYSIIFKDYNKKYNVYDAIMYQWHSRCKKYYEEHKTIDISNNSDSFYSYTEEESSISMEDDGDLLSCISSYKYYAIIIIYIVSIVIIYKKRRRNKR